jgi:hypothetical protein
MPWDYRASFLDANALPHEGQPTRPEESGAHSNALSRMTHTLPTLPSPGPALPAALGVSHLCVERSASTRAGPANDTSVRRSLHRGQRADLPPDRMNTVKERLRLGQATPFPRFLHSTPIVGPRRVTGTPPN